MAKAAKATQRETAQHEGELHLITVPLDELHDHPDNDYPNDPESMADLMDSIQRDGLAQPPLVRKVADGYQIIAGHRRVECFRRLAEGDAAYATIPVNVIDGCDDDRALVLLDVTNLMVRQLTVVERSKRYERLWKTVPQLRERQPELKGVRTSQIIADMITRETGQPVSRATIDRALAAGRRALEVSELVEQYADALIDPWVQEFRQREGFSPTAVKEVASRDESVQRQLLADYQVENLTPKQLEKRLAFESPKTDADIEHALDTVIATLRNVSAWHKKYGAAVDMYRIEHIRDQLSRITRG